MEMVKNRPSTWSALVLLLVLQAGALFLFTNGFFLTRYEVQDISMCSEINDASTIQPNGHLRHRHEQIKQIKSGCWYPQKFKRAVYIVIDALRYDFVGKTTSSQQPNDNTGAAFYINHLPYIQHLLDNQPEQSLLYRFVADAPTMTMQRIKGLTTGGLPTFLDIKDNMQTSEIVEDSLIKQLFMQNKRIIFMGDDTWDSLYGPYFARNYSYSSFNVKDLHTVDNGVEEHLFPEMMKDDWDIIIAHFLGG